MATITLATLLSTEQFTNKISSRTFFDNNKMPYVLCCVRVVNGEKDIKSVPKGWMDWTYEKCCTYNKSVDARCQTLNVNLRKSPYMVIDIDKEDKLGYGLETFGNDWVSYSTRRKLPHLWRKKQDQDISPDATDVNGNGFDLRYSNIFENVNNYIYYNEEITEFIIHDHPNPKFKTQSKSTLPQQNTNNPDNIEHNKNIEFLDIIDPKYWTEFDSWKRLVMAIKITFPDENEAQKLALHFSAKSTNNFDEESVINLLETDPTSLTCGTIRYYAKKSDEVAFADINTKYKLLKKKDSKDNFNELKEDFELTHAKIINKALYIHETDEGVIFFKESNLIIAYRHLKFDKPKYNKEGNISGYSKESFISEWINSQDIRYYNDIDIFPPPLICPDNIFNMWKPFFISTLTDEYEPNKEGLNLFKSHINILCGNDSLVANYLIKWIAQMFQYPAVKTNIPTFISNPGAGKTSLIELLEKMMGRNKVLITTTPSRDVWGQFNSLMSECFLVNLNELSKKETVESEGKIKGLITDPQLTINSKGQNSYLIKSVHRFIGTTNKNDPFNTEHGDRRNWVVRSSDEKINDKIYFDNLRNLFNDINVQRTIYDYLMSIPNMDCFNSLPLPNTAYQNDMKDISRSPFDRWIEYLIIDNNINNADSDKNKVIEFTSAEQYKSFKSWTTANGIVYDTTSIKMVVSIKRLNVPGISSIHTNKGNIQRYDPIVLGSHYKLDKAEN